MREIKFRQYLNGKFHYWGYVDEFGFTSPLSNNPDLESERFTGLKDKNGVEIYEGDIIRYYQPYAKRTDEHIVKWDTEWAGFGLFEKYNKWCKESDWVKIQDLEVIGNIHENPELL